MLTWNVVDNTGRRIGRVRAMNYGRAFVLAQDKYRDRMSAVLVRQTGPKTRPTPAMLAAAGDRYNDRENFPSWDAGR